MATLEQLKLSIEYREDGWPTKHLHEVVGRYTPEERLLSEALDILSDVLDAPLPAITLTALERVKGLVEPVFNVVSDYHHAQARLTEVESEVESQKERIELLEAELLERPPLPDEEN